MLVFFSNLFEVDIDNFNIDKKQTVYYFPHWNFERRDWIDYERILSTYLAYLLTLFKQQIKSIHQMKSK